MNRSPQENLLLDLALDHLEAIFGERARNPHLPREVVTEAVMKVAIILAQPSSVVVEEKGAHEVVFETVSYTPDTPAYEHSPHWFDRNTDGFSGDT